MAGSNGQMVKSKQLVERETNLTRGVRYYGNATQQKSVSCPPMPFIILHGCVGGCWRVANFWKPTTWKEGLVVECSSTFTKLCSKNLAKLY